MLLPILAIVAYALTLLWVAPTLVNLESATENKKPNITLVFGFGLLAILLHCVIQPIMVNRRAEFYGNECDLFNEFHYGDLCNFCVT